MGKIKSIIGYGVLVWLVPFVAGLALFPLRSSNRTFFESIMPVVLVGVTVWASHKLKKLETTRFLEVGLVWLVISVILDQAFFTWGPQKMPFASYWMDIGFTYLVIPAIVWLAKPTETLVKPAIVNTENPEVPEVSV
jgi:hypothetical protein